jgi:hypothetical protein
MLNEMFKSELNSNKPSEFYNRQGTMIFDNGVEIVATAKMTVFATNTEVEGVGYELTFDIIGNAPEMSAKQLAREVMKHHIREIFHLFDEPSALSLDKSSWQVSKTHDEQTMIWAFPGINDRFQGGVSKHTYTREGKQASGFRFLVDVEGAHRFALGAAKNLTAVTYGLLGFEVLYDLDEIKGVYTVVDGEMN